MTDTVEGPCDCTGPHFHSVVHDCCARLSTVEAERETELAAVRLLHREVDDLRARLAEVEVERDRADMAARTFREQRESAIARLAAVLTLCEDASEFDTLRDFVKHVRAAATGEDVR